MVEASHPDYKEGRVTCRVAPGGHTECDVPVYGEEPVIRGGCTTGGEAGSSILLPVAILLLGLVFKRRS